MILQTLVLQSLQTIVAENQRLSTHLAEDELGKLTQRLMDNGRVFASGEGRSGLVIRMFACKSYERSKNSFLTGSSMPI